MFSLLFKIAEKKPQPNYERKQYTDGLIKENQRCK